MKCSNKKRAVHLAMGLSWRRHLHRCLAMVALLSGSIAFARPPAVPLIQPLYTFDGNSPTVQDGTVGSGDLLRPAGDTPVVLVPGENLGIGQPGDELDGLSGTNSIVGPTDTFAILFSIDRASVGGSLPDIILAAQGVPYNAADQIAKGHGAGDQFISLNLFDRSGGAFQGRNAAAVDNNALVFNNYDEGGVDFSAKPTTSAEDNIAARGVVPQDNVNSTSGTSFPSSSRSAGPDVGPTFFTLSQASPSLQLLPGLPSGANIYLVFDPTQLPPDRILFASFEDLGLVQTDEISAVIVFDGNGDGLFNGSDQVMFTLGRGSPSLGTITKTGVAASSADVFSVDASGAIIPIATAASLGLDGATDSIDALDYLPCTDAPACAALHGIRAPLPNVPAVSTWSLVVMIVLVLISGTVVLRRRRANVQAVE